MENQLRYAATSDIGKKKENQDAYFFEYLNDHVFLFGVFDGHGEHGKRVADFLKSNIGKVMKEDKFFLKRKFKYCFETCFEELHTLLIKSDINTEFSGSTGTVCLVYRNQLFCGWVGDSRAVVASVDGTDFVADNLSCDHNCSDPNEKKRILKSGGRIAPMLYQGKLAGPLRLWKGTNNFPGQTVTRSFGDEVAHTCGVTHVPEVFSRTILPTDRAVIVASDGIWDCLRNENVATIVQGRRYDPASDVSSELIRKALLVQKEKGFADNLTAAVVFLGESASLKSPPVSPKSSVSSFASLATLFRIKRPLTEASTSGSNLRD